LVTIQWIRHKRNSGFAGSGRGMSEQILSHERSEKYLCRVWVGKISKKGHYPIEKHSFVHMSDESLGLAAEKRRDLSQGRIL
jgi:hypothetical protein